MTDLGRLVEKLEEQLRDVEFGSRFLLVLLPQDGAGLLSAARELEALKEAMEEMRGWNPNETVCEEIKTNAAAILAEKERKRAE